MTPRRLIKGIVMSDQEVASWVIGGMLGLIFLAFGYVLWLSKDGLTQEEIEQERKNYEANKNEYWNWYWF